MINPSFTRGEYWLLEAVAELAMPICWLDWADMEEALNKAGHGMPRPFLVDTMLKLFTEGLITAQQCGKWDDSLIFTSEQIVAALDEKQDKKEHYYRLTPKGGEYWEAFARPNWNLYINAGFGLPEDNDIWDGELICAEKDHIESYYQSLRYHDYDVYEDSVQWDTLKPWNATCWKTLPIGHRVRFRCREKENTNNLGLPRPIDQLWYDRLWYQWR